jgi:uncharacterized protein YcbK (DUF882 family)
VPGRYARQFLALTRPSRVGYCCGIAALALIFSCENLQNAVADGETRTITMHHLHTGENITVTFKREGRYDPEALKKLDWFLRDWRQEKAIHMDPHLIDLMWEVKREFNTGQPIDVVCGYRSPHTNAMLRRRGRGVARHSQHMLGKALDFYIPGVPLAELRVVGLRLQRGGVGYYPTSGSPFVHMDVGSVRHWPRMTREQLVKVFPNGRTVHIPRDGRPLKNYALALADIERRHSSMPSNTSLAAAREAGVVNGQTLEVAENTVRSRPSFFARLFHVKSSDEDEDRELTSSTGRARTAPAAKPEPTVVASTAKEPAQTALPTEVPLPTRRPTMSYQLASAEPSRPAPAPKGPDTASMTPNEIIKARGFWQGLPEVPSASASRPTHQMLAAATPEASAVRRKERDSAPATTASVTPWPVKAEKDRVSPEIALSYAAQEAPLPARKAAAMGRRVPSNMKTAAIPPHTTVATKATPDQPTAALTAQSLLAAAMRARRGGALNGNDPWLRAMVIAPDVRTHMTTALFGMPDFRNLSPLLTTPTSAVMMTFALDPYLGLTSNRFSGDAVVFVSTVTFNNRTALLQ